MNKIFLPGDILVPKDTDMSLWSVIACDQYTAQPEYWESVEKRVGDKPSTLKLIIPEAFLEKRNTEEMTGLAEENMRKYLSEGVLRTLENSFVYVERDMTVGEKRHGLVGLVDLEAYDFRSDSTSPIRATEGTVESRLPARVKLREGAALELPHIVIFIDDPENTVFGAIKTDEQLYNFDLMDGGGHIEGFRVSGGSAVAVESALESLWTAENLEKRYHLPEKPPVLIAMGDGNHSLAAARLCWENAKKNLSLNEQENHPARFALAELVNIHDRSIKFEPIHRVLFDTDESGFLDEARAYFSAISAPGSGTHKLALACGEKRESISITGHTIGEVIAFAQSFCMEYLKNHGGSIDYIHDDETALSLAAKPGSAGVLLPPMDKNELFPSIIKSGAFPAKSFSIGPSRDKRYYLECRTIK